MKAKKRSEQKKVTPGMWHRYTEERESFYTQHPYSRLLLGIFIFAFSLYIAVQIRAFHESLVGVALMEEGIEYQPKIVPSVKKIP